MPVSRLIPRGATVAGLGKRFLAAVLDTLPFVVIAVVATLATRATTSNAVSLVVLILGGVLGAGFGLYQWWAYGTRGAGLGARVTGLRVVSMRDGEPIGWWRSFLRLVVFSALMATFVGGVALLIFLVIHERRQGWHDMVGGAVVVEPRQMEAKAAAALRKVPATTTVGLPPHLSSSFSPQVGSTAAWAPGAQTGPPPAPEWLPGVQAEPVAPQPPGQPWAPQSQPPATPAWGAQPASTQQWPAPKPSQPTGSPPPQAPKAPAQSQWPGETQPPVSPTRPVASWIPIPSASSVIEPSNKIRVRPREFGEVEDDDGTRIANVPASARQRPGDEGWYLRLDDAREVDLGVTVLLGRNPHKSVGDPEEVHLVPASGDGRMISRTHVLIGTDPRGVFVIDRGSTNGTAVVVTGGELEPCPPGTQVRVREGQQVSYGNRWFTVLRRPVL